jgi:hypothetical protein
MQRIEHFLSLVRGNCCAALRTSSAPGIAPDRRMESAFAPLRLSRRPPAGVTTSLQGVRPLTGNATADYERRYSQVTREEIVSAWLIAGVTLLTLLVLGWPGTKGGRTESLHPKTIRLSIQPHRQFFSADQRLQANCDMSRVNHIGAWTIKVDACWHRMIAALKLTPTFFRCPTHSLAWASRQNRHPRAGDPG